MDKGKWMKEARRWAQHAYCYEGMVDEFPEEFEAAYLKGNNPYDAVDLFAVDADLDRADGFYGINSDREFVKAEGFA